MPPHYKGGKNTRSTWIYQPASTSEYSLHYMTIFEPTYDVLNHYWWIHIKWLINSIVYKTSSSLIFEYWWTTLYDWIIPYTIWLFANMMSYQPLVQSSYAYWEMPPANCQIYQVGYISLWYPHIRSLNPLIHRLFKIHWNHNLIHWYPLVN